MTGPYTGSALSKLPASADGRRDRAESHRRRSRASYVGRNVTDAGGAALVLEDLGELPVKNIAWPPRIFYCAIPATSPRTWQSRCGRPGKAVVMGG
jgi:hypothetical protein